MAKWEVISVITYLTIKLDRCLEVSYPKEMANLIK